MLDLEPTTRSHDAGPQSSTNVSRESQHARVLANSRDNTCRSNSIGLPVIFVAANRAGSPALTGQTTFRDNLTLFELLRREDFKALISKLAKRGEVRVDRLVALLASECVLTHKRPLMEAKQTSTVHGAAPTQMCSDQNRPSLLTAIVVGGICVEFGFFSSTTSLKSLHLL